jgi:hypothetical protein
MCRKVIYEICDKQKAKGDDYKKKIKSLILNLLNWLEVYISQMTKEPKLKKILI